MIKSRKAKICTGILGTVGGLYLALVVVFLTRLPLSALLFEIQPDNADHGHFVRAFPRQLGYRYVLCCRGYQKDRQTDAMSQEKDYIAYTVSTSIPLGEKKALIESFIKKGADITQSTALDAAVMSQVEAEQDPQEVFALVQFLLEHGAKINMANSSSKKMTPQESAEYLAKKRKTDISLKILSLINQYKDK